MCESVGYNQTFVFILCFLVFVEMIYLSNVFYFIIQDVDTEIFILIVMLLWCTLSSQIRSNEQDPSNTDLSDIGNIDLHDACILTYFIKCR